jgi:hypothetical protein
MHTLNQMDPSLYAEVLRKQARVWEDLGRTLEDLWKRSVSLRWAVKTRISSDEVLADLAYGRD